MIPDKKLPVVHRDELDDLVSWHEAQNEGSELGAAFVPPWIWDVGQMDPAEVPPWLWETYERISEARYD